MPTRIRLELTPEQREQLISALQFAHEYTYSRSSADLLTLVSAAPALDYPDDEPQLEKTTDGPPTDSQEYRP